MKVSRRWIHGLALAILLGFSGLVFGGKATLDNRPPIPEKVTGSGGTVITTAGDILGGQAVFQKYGLMDYGSVFGHGAYLGPDFTAEYLHRMAELMREHYAQELYSRAYAALSPEQQALVGSKVTTDLKTNRLDAASGTLTLTPAQEKAYLALKKEYADRFSRGDPSLRIPREFIKESGRDPNDRWLSDKTQVDQLSDFFAWTAWAAAANRPGLDYTYTNNWPPDDSAGNRPSRQAVVWSAASVGLLMLLLGFILYLYRRHELHASDGELGEVQHNLLPAQVTPSQVKTAKYFLVVAGLFLAQVLVGALAAHYFVEPKFFGIDLQGLLPFNIARGWHLQLAVFWVATAWLGMGLFVAPLVGGKEPRGQGLLVDILFGAVVVVAVGSLVGEWLGVKGYLGKLWFLLGNQGWEYLELGRIWQILLLGGMLIWLFIVFRALRYRLIAEESKGTLSYLMLYAAISIPGFYGFGLLYDPGTNFTVADFWRWFVIHLWVEGMFEFFTVVVTAYLMVNLGLVRERSATRSVYFTLALVFGTGLIGTGHHYYFNGAPAIWMALGAVFSALEVIPLTLLIFEAWDHYRLLTKAGSRFPYRESMLFLIATAVWNFLGAGVLGFLANLPVVNYYEHGTYLTPAHGHASMMGAYGMLALALLTFTFRSIVKPEFWKAKAVTASFWLLNIGLAAMLALNLIPMGFLQLSASFGQGTWFARSFDFINQGVIQTLVWLRLPADVIFIAGVVALGYAVVTGIFHLRKAAPSAPERVPSETMASAVKRG